MECINEVVPLFFLRELRMVFPFRMPPPSEDKVRKAVAPVVGIPDKCVVTLV